MVFETKDVSISGQITDVSAGKISGYFAIKNVQDDDRDTIVDGAFTKTIKEQGPLSALPRIKHFLNHDINRTVGKLLELEEDAKGLRYVSQAGTNSVGVDTVKMIESGLITEHSIGYEVVKSIVNDPDGNWATRTRTITELKLWEGSCLTAWGANMFTGPATLKMKSEQPDKYVLELKEKMARMEKFFRNSDATDDTLQLVEIYIKQLHAELLAAIKSTKPDTESTKPDANEIVAAFKEARSIIQFQNALVYGN